MAKRALPDITPSLNILTLGCRLNAHESDVMRRNADAAGVEDTVIINTCAVTGEAVRQARQAIRKARRERPGARVVVTGCAAQIDPASFAAMPEVDRVIGNQEKLQPGIFSSDRTGQARVAVGDIMATRESPPVAAIDRVAARARALIQVQTGCDHRCTFCIIPFGRGNSRSAPLEQVLAQVRRLVDSEHYEVVLTGVDLTSWGADLPGAPRLGDLVAAILQSAPDLPQIRLSSIDAIELDERLFELVAHEPRVAPYLHLSLQSGDDLILKRMKRRHLRADAIALCERLRAVRPEIAFGADVIAGFPTETEAMFENTLSLIDQCGIDYVHVFPYSPRPGTPAARMPGVASAEIRDRAARLRAKGAERLAKRLDSHLGRSELALVESGGRARLPDFAPIRYDGPELPAGRPARFVLIGRTDAELMGRPA